MSPWENVVAQRLCEAEIAVAGLDLKEYAENDYDQAVLAKDWAEVARLAWTRCGLTGPPQPVIYGGWSMGAVQAVAAAGPGRPEGLVGLLLLSADYRGRSGLRTSDELGITPEGPGTFALADFTKDMAGLRVAQFHGTSDFMASTAWIRSLTSPHALYLVPGANHGFDGPSDSFREVLLRGVDWVLGDEAAAPLFEGAEHSLPFGLSPLWPGALLAVCLSLVFLFSRHHSMRLLVAAVALMGGLNIAEVLVGTSTGLWHWLDGIVPLDFPEQSRVPLFFSGLVLLGLARGLGRRKRVAWIVVMGLLSFSVVLHTLRAFDWQHALAALVLILPLVRWRREFVAHSDAYSLRWSLRLAPLLLLGLLVFGTISIRRLAERGEFGTPLSWAESFHGAWMASTLQRSELDEYGSRGARAFLADLRGASVLVLLFVGAGPASGYSTHA